MSGQDSAGTAASQASSLRPVDSLTTCEVEFQVVARVVGGAAVIDEQLEADLARIAGDGAPVLSVHRVVAGGQDEDGERAVAVVGDVKVLLSSSVRRW